MSTQTEITRLQTARNKLRTWLVGLGLAASTDKLGALADKASAIKITAQSTRRSRRANPTPSRKAITTAPAPSRASEAAATTSCKPRPSRRPRSSRPSRPIRAITACPA